MILSADIEDQARPAGNNVRCIGLDLENARCRNEVSLLARSKSIRAFVDEQHQLRSGETRIPAIFHWRGAGMIGRTLEHDLDAGDADDRCDKAEINLVVLQDHALLDVQLEITG